MDRINWWGKKNNELCGSFYVVRFQGKNFKKKLIDKESYKHLGKGEDEGSDISPVSSVIFWGFLNKIRNELKGGKEGGKEMRHSISQKKGAKNRGLRGNVLYPFVHVGFYLKPLVNFGWLRWSHTQGSTN